MSADPNVYYCSLCGYEYKDYLHRNGSFQNYCPRCKKETLFSNALREIFENKANKASQQLLEE